MRPHELQPTMNCISPVPGIFQARVLEWGTIAFSKNKAYWGENLEGMRNSCETWSKG